MRRFFKVLSAVVAVQVAALWAVQGAAGAGPKEVKIGFQGVLSGNSAAIGDGARVAAQFLVDKVNAAGGVNGTKLKLVVIDDKGDPNDAVEAANRLIEAEGVVAIVNGGTSTTLLAASQVAQRRGVPMIGHVQSSPEITQQGNKFVFRVSVTADGLADPVAEYAVKDMKLKRIAIIARNDGYGNSIKEAFDKKAKSLGGQIVEVETYNPTEKDFKSYLLKIQASKPDAIMMTGFYADAGLITKQVGEMGLKTQLLGQNTLTAPGYLSIAGAAAEGVIFSANYLPGVLSSKGAQQFVKEWTQAFGKQPEVYAAHGYDATAVIIEAMKLSGSFEPAKIRDGLFKIRKFDGASGMIQSFMPNGDVDKDVVLCKIKDGKLVPIKTY